MAHQHQGLYLEGDKVWYQNKDGKSWCGPAVVHCQKGRSVCIHLIGEMKKVAACKVNPYELVERDQGEISGNKMDQGEKDDEEKVDLIDNTENDELIEKTQDSVGAYNEDGE